MPGKSPNAGYLHLLQQVRLYYPDGAGKLQEMIENDKEHWRVAIHAAVKNGELRKDIDVENVILLYHHFSWVCLMRCLCLTDLIPICSIQVLCVCMMR